MKFGERAAFGAVVTCAANAVDRSRAQVMADADLTLVGRSSRKAALDTERLEKQEREEVHSVCGGFGSDSGKLRIGFDIHLVARFI